MSDEGTAGVWRVTELSGMAPIYYRLLSVSERCPWLLITPMAFDTTSVTDIAFNAAELRA
jgi:hypothetical protein